MRQMELHPVDDQQEFPASTMPSHDRLVPIIASVWPQRIDSLKRCDNSIISYDPTSFRLIFNIRGRNLESILAPLLFIAIWSCTWALMHSLEAYTRHVSTAENATNEADETGQIGQQPDG